MRHDQALAVVAHVVANTPGPVSVFVGDLHGEQIAAVSMDGAGRDTLFNAERKAFTIARCGADSTLALGEATAADPSDRRNFDPRYTFWPGGVSAFDGDRRIAVVAVSGLEGTVDDRLARAAIEAVGFSVR